MAGEKNRTDCVLNKTNISLEIDGKKIMMVPFVQNILRNAVLGVVKELDGYHEGAQIKISIGDSYDKR